jgi:hypothetical protein
MVPFHLEIELEEGTVGLEVEQLDYLADEDGFIRYDVRSVERRAVISVPIERSSDPDELSFSAVQAADEAFSDEDIVRIMKAIQDYNEELAAYFKRFMQRNKN